MNGRKPIVLSLLAGIGLALVLLVAWPDRLPRDNSATEGRDASPHGVKKPAGAQQGRAVLLVGGGALPDSNEVQIEDDVLLARRILGEGQRVLFAGGRSAKAVQVQGRTIQGDPLLAELAQLFSPRRGRDSTYRRTRVSGAKAASKQVLENELRALVADDTETSAALVFIGHGDKGAKPAENVWLLWGQGTLTAGELAELLDREANRPLVAIATSCFSGGFSEIVFPKAEQTRERPRHVRCGLFSTTWDLEASGCDPNPDRRLHEGYGVHFFQALAGRDRHGEKALGTGADYDKDGVITFLEAHTWVRIHSKGIDVPTTTSERWLRYIGPQTSATVDVELPEEDAVLMGLAARLGLPEGSAVEQATARFEALQQQLVQLSDKEDTLKQRLDAAYLRVAGAMLAIWPVIDDPWHPDFQATIQRERGQVEAWLQSSREYADYLLALNELNALDDALMLIRTESAPLERFLRSHRTRMMASRLAAQGGTDWDVYQALLKCERTQPNALGVMDHANQGFSK